MSKYLIEFTRFNASAQVEYSEGYLHSLVFDKGGLSEEHIKSFYLQVPWREIHVKEKWAKVQNVRVSDIPEDLSFERFWEQYDHKLCKKERAKGIWNKMPDAERLKALNYIARYDQWLSAGTIAKRYADTYLNTKLWNN
jgi:hypothetical protein